MMPLKRLVWRSRKVSSSSRAPPGVELRLTWSRHLAQKIAQLVWGGLSMSNGFTSFIRSRCSYLFVLRDITVDWLHASKKLKNTGMGFKLIGNKEMESGQFEPGETKVFIEHIDGCDVLINIGANIGYYCCIALSLGKYVVAFEPIVSNVRCLLRNIKENGFDNNIEIYPVAVGDKTGVIEIYGRGTGASIVKGWAGMSERSSSLVPCLMIDTVLGNKFDGKRCLIVVDIEGAEEAMLEGASSLLKMEPKPVWLMEISVQANQPRGRNINPHLLSIFERFWSRGYEAWTTHFEHRLVTREEVERIVDGGKDTLWGDTFLFISEQMSSEIRTFEAAVKSAER